jgi:hypothetical protein
MEGSEVHMSVQVPPELTAGAYANVVGIWHTEHEFTLDFAVMMPTNPPQAPGEAATMPCEVVARVKIAPTLVFDILRALNENMTVYETTYGEIRRPGQTADEDQL